LAPGQAESLVVAVIATPYRLDSNAVGVGQAAWTAESLYRSGSIGIAESGIPISRPDLLHAWPSPFNQSLHIGLAHPTNCATASMVEIYDASGRLVRSLPLAHPSGTNPSTTVWDGRDMARLPSPAGVYFCCLSEKGTAKSTLKVVKAQE